MNSGHVALSTKFRDLHLWLFLSSVSPKLSGFQELLFPIIWLEKKFIWSSSDLISHNYVWLGQPSVPSGENKGGERGKNIKVISPLFLYHKLPFIWVTLARNMDFSPRDFGAGVMVITLQIHDLGCPWCRPGRKNRRNKTTKKKPKTKTQWESLGSKWEGKRGKIAKKLVSIRIFQL